MQDTSKTYVNARVPHARLDEWLKGRAIDKALKAMNISAVAKKPGRVSKRVGKSLSDIFDPLRVVQWDKDIKVAYASAITSGAVGDVLRGSTEGAEKNEMAVFQTDLYFRANKDVTEVNASTVAAMTTNAVSAMLSIGGGEVEERVRFGLTRARLYQTGLPFSGIPPESICRVLVPAGEFVLDAATMPIDRVEFDEQKTGQVVVVTDVVALADLDEKSRNDVQEMTVAMTRDGHPGDQAFGEMIAARASHVTDIKTGF